MDFMLTDYIHISVKIVVLHELTESYSLIANKQHFSVLF